MSSTLSLQNNGSTRQANTHAWPTLPQDPPWPRQPLLTLKQNHNTQLTFKHSWHNAQIEAPTTQSSIHDTLRHSQHHNFKKKKTTTQLQGGRRKRRSTAHLQNGQRELPMALEGCQQWAQPCVHACTLC
eukprot:1159822-Pelagomonas_calceolata.AAC.5